MHLKSIALVALVAAVSGGCKCSPPPTKATAEKAATSQKKADASKSRGRKEVEPGTTHRIAVGGSSVAYTVHLPDNAAPGAALPALVMLLDRGETTSRFADQYNVVRGAKKLGYVLALVSPPGGKRAHWGHGSCKAETTPAAASATPSAAKPIASPPAPSSSAVAPQAPTTDDLALVNAVISDLGQKNKLDATKLTVIGVGEGGIMAHRVASELPSVSSAVLVNPRAECTAPTAPIPPEQGRSVLIVAGPASSQPDAGAPTPAWEKLAFDTWTAAGKCDTKAAKKDKDKQSTITTHSCADGRVVRFVEDAKVRRGWPSRLSNVFMMRVIHNFLTQP